MGILTVTERIALVRCLPTKYYESREVARSLGIERTTLHKWRERGVPEAQSSAQMLHKGEWVYLWTPADVERLREYAGTARKRVKYWTEEQIRDRGSRTRSLRWHLDQVEALRERGMRAAARDHARIARELRAGLDKQRAQRRAEIAKERSRACCGGQRAKSA